MAFFQGEVDINWTLRVKTVAIIRSRLGGGGGGGVGEGDESGDIDAGCKKGPIWTMLNPPK